MDLNLKGHYLIYSRNLDITMNLIKPGDGYKIGNVEGKNSYYHFVI